MAKFLNAQGGYDAIRAAKAISQGKVKITPDLVREFEEGTRFRPRVEDPERPGTSLVSPGILTYLAAAQGNTLAKQAIKPTISGGAGKYEQAQQYTEPYIQVMARNAARAFLRSKGVQTSADEALPVQTIRPAPGKYRGLVSRSEAKGGAEYYESKRIRSLLTPGGSRLVETPGGLVSEGIVSGLKTRVRFQDFTPAQKRDVVSSIIRNAPAGLTPKQLRAYVSEQFRVQETRNLTKRQEDVLRTQQAIADGLINAPSLAEPQLRNAPTRKTREADINRRRKIVEASFSVLGKTKETALASKETRQAIGQFLREAETLKGSPLTTKEKKELTQEATNALRKAPSPYSIAQEDIPARGTLERLERITGKPIPPPSKRFPAPGTFKPKTKQEQRAFERAVKNIQRKPGENIRVNVRAGTVERFIRGQKEPVQRLAYNARTGELSPVGLVERTTSVRAAVGGRAVEPALESQLFAYKLSPEEKESIRFVSKKERDIFEELAKIQILGGDISPTKAKVLERALANRRRANEKAAEKVLARIKSFDKKSKELAELDRQLDVRSISLADSQENRANLFVSSALVAKRNRLASTLNSSSSSINEEIRRIEGEQAKLGLLERRLNQKVVGSTLGSVSERFTESFKTVQAKIPFFDITVPFNEGAAVIGTAGLYGAASAGATGAAALGALALAPLAAAKAAGEATRPIFERYAQDVLFKTGKPLTTPVEPGENEAFLSNAPGSIYDIYSAQLGVRPSRSITAPYRLFKGIKALAIPEEKPTTVRGIGQKAGGAIETGVFALSSIAELKAAEGVLSRLASTRNARAKVNVKETLTETRTAEELIGRGKVFVRGESLSEVSLFGKSKTLRATINEALALEVSTGLRATKGTTLAERALIARGQAYAEQILGELAALRPRIKGLPEEGGLLSRGKFGGRSFIGTSTAGEEVLAKGPKTTIKNVRAVSGIELEVPGPLAGLRQAKRSLVVQARTEAKALRTRVNNALENIPGRSAVERLSYEFPVFGRGLGEKSLSIPDVLMVRRGLGVKQVDFPLPPIKGVSKTDYGRGLLGRFRASTTNDYYFGKISVVSPTQATKNFLKEFTEYSFTIPRGIKEYGTDFVLRGIKGRADFFSRKATFQHEFGHFLSYLDRGKFFSKKAISVGKVVKEFKKASRIYEQELGVRAGGNMNVEYVLGQKNISNKAEEAIAESTRIFFKRPDILKKEAPTIYDILDKTYSGFVKSTKQATETAPKIFEKGVLKDSIVEKYRKQISQVSKKYFSQSTKLKTRTKTIPETELLQYFGSDYAVQPQSIKEILGVYLGRFEKSKAEKLAFEIIEPGKSVPAKKGFTRVISKVSGIEKESDVLTLRGKPIKARYFEGKAGGQIIETESTTPFAGRIKAVSTERIKLKKEIGIRKPPSKTSFFQPGKEFKEAAKAVSGKETTKIALKEANAFEKARKQQEIVVSSLKETAKAEAKARAISRSTLQKEIVRQGIFREYVQPTPASLTESISPRTPNLNVAPKELFGLQARETQTRTRTIPRQPAPPKTSLPGIAITGAITLPDFKEEVSKRYYSFFQTKVKLAGVLKNEAKPLQTPFASSAQIQKTMTDFGERMVPTQRFDERILELKKPKVEQLPVSIPRVVEKQKTETIPELGFSSFTPTQYYTPPRPTPKPLPIVPGPMFGFPPGYALPEYYYGRGVRKKKKAGRGVAKVDPIARTFAGGPYFLETQPAKKIYGRQVRAFGVGLAPGIALPSRLKEFGATNKKIKSIFGFSTQRRKTR